MCLRKHRVSELAKGNIEIDIESVVLIHELGRFFLKIFNIYNILQYMREKYYLIDSVRVAVLLNSVGVVPVCFLKVRLNTDFELKPTS